LDQAGECDAAFGFSSVDLKGPQAVSQKTPDARPPPRAIPHDASPVLRGFAVYAFPSTPPVISDISEKALYKREPYTSYKYVKPYLPTPTPAFSKRPRDSSEIEKSPPAATLIAPTIPTKPTHHYCPLACSDRSKLSQ